MQKELLVRYAAELENELASILDYWTRYTPDTGNGGFIGRIDENNIAYPGAPKGSVLNSRILWAFSSAYTLTGDQQYLHSAERAYAYLSTYFIDKQFGGVYWLLHSDGSPLDTRKQIYAQAFALYACSAYYTSSRNEFALQIAIELFRVIEKYSYDSIRSGYLEALSRDWTAIEDLRLSDKDANEKKTMNTHLHILEGYTALYRIWPDALLKSKIEGLLYNFFQYILDVKSYHLGLFFDEHWNRKGDVISYGHDIEAAWLLLEAAESIHDSDLIETAKKIAVNIANAAVAGVDHEDGGMWYEYEPAINHLIMEKHSWVQAEAMVGFFNAWQISGDERYLSHSFGSWQYVKHSIKDEVFGEWFWGRNGDGSVMAGQDKAGIWKCPYHNSRACMEIIQRIKKIVA